MHKPPESVRFHQGGGATIRRQVDDKTERRTNVKLLPIDFTKWGDRFQQIKRNAVAAMYERTSPQGPANLEVWVINRQKAGPVFGRDLPERELPPPTSSWGTRGWTCLDTVKGRAEAEEKYQSVSAERSRRGDLPSSPSGNAAMPQSADVAATKGHSARGGESAPHATISHGERMEP